MNGPPLVFAQAHGPRTSEEEEWRICFGGFYEVSSHGRVRRAKPGTATFVGRPLRPIRGTTGYAQVALHGEKGVCKRVYIHRLVAEVFLGPCPPGNVVNHKDADKSNNALSNLEYVTAQQNSQHAMRVVGRRRGPTKPKPPLKGKPIGDKHWSRRMPERVARGECQGSAKLTTEVVRRVKERLAAGERQKDLAREFGISVAQMSRIARGKRWAHVTVTEEK